MSDPSVTKRRRIIYINPRMQGGIAIVFAAIIVVGAALFAWLVHSDIKQALWESAYRGHFLARTPYRIVDDILVSHLAGLFLGVLAVSFLAFFLLLRRIRTGVRQVADAFARSAEGDLATPTAAAGLKELATFGKQVDAARLLTLSRIEGIRADLAFLRSCPASAGEFRRRWDSMKEKIGGLLP